MHPVEVSKMLQVRGRRRVDLLNDVEDIIQYLYYIRYLAPDGTSYYIFPYHY
jgi:hypothetical protein